MGTVLFDSQKSPKLAAASYGLFFIIYHCRRDSISVLSAVFIPDLYFISFR